jgi:CDP-glycerol glycerophosphotransferase
MALVSVVMPIYNVEPYLDECLESIASQGVEDLEVIMVDDGSSDASADIAERFAARDGRFQLIRQANGGSGKARNTGVAAATGEFLAFVDSDDKLPPNAYELLLGTLQGTGSDFAAGNATRFSEGGTAPSHFLRRAFATTRLKTHVSRFPALIADRIPWNKLFRRAFWDAHRLRFPEGVYHQDIPVMVPAHFLARSVDVIAEPVYLYRIRGGDDRSVTQRRLEPRVLRDRLAAIQQVQDFLDRQGLEDGRRRYDESVLADDLPRYLDDLEHADPEYRDLFIGGVEDFLRRACPHVFDGLSPLLRLKWHLGLRRLWPQLFEVVRFEREELDGARPVRVGWRWYADYPYRTDARLGIPASVYAYTPRYVARRLLDGERAAPLRAAVRSLRLGR